MLSSDEHADLGNNIICTTASGSRLAMLSESGFINLRSNWLKGGWVASHSSSSGSVVDHGSNIEGTDPGFHDFASQDYSPNSGGEYEDVGGSLPAGALPDHAPVSQYSRH